MPYPRFTKVIINHFISKDKTISMRNRINLHTIRDDNLLGTLIYVSKIEDYHKYGALILEQMINQAIQDSKEYKIYLSFATGEATPKKGRKFKKNASPSKKQTHKDVSSKKPLRKELTGVQIRDTPDVSVSKKEPATTDRNKGIDLLSEAALLEDAQMKKVLKQSKRETHSHQESGSGDGVGSKPKVLDELQTTGINEGTSTIPGVPNVPKDQSESENESWGESGDDDDDSNDDECDDDNGNNDASDDERTDFDDDLNDDDKEEEYEDVYVYVNVKLKDVEHGEEGKGEAEMTDTGHDNVTQETTYDQVEDDAHVTLTSAHVTQKTKVPLQTDATTITLPIPLVIPLPQLLTITPTPITKATTSLLAIPDLSSLFGFNQRVYALEKELTQLKQVDYSAQLLEAIKSQVPVVVEAHLGTRLRDTIQQVLKEEVKSEGEKKSVDFRPPQTWINIISQAKQPPISFDELMSTPIDFSAYVMNHLKIDNLTQDHLVGPVFNLLKGTCKSHVKLEYNIKECYKAVVDRLDWNNPEGKEYMFDLSKLLLLIMDRGRQVDLVDYFIKNDLEYLRRGSSSKRYTISKTKTKAAKYDIQGIEDMVPSLWSPIKVSYDRDTIWGTSHWGPKRQRFNGFASNKVSKHDVYSTIVVTKVKVMKWYDYSYLEEIEVAYYRFRDVSSVIFELSELKLPIRLFTLRHDLGVFHLRILTRRLLNTEDEAPIEEYIPEVASAPTPPLPPSFLSPRIRPPHIRAAMAQMRATVPSTYHSLLPSGTPLLLPVPSTSRRAKIPEADTPPRKRLLLTAPRPGCEVEESFASAAMRQLGPTMARSVDCSFVDTMETRESLEFYSRHQDAQKDRASVRAEIEVLRRERLAYEHEIVPRLGYDCINISNSTAAFQVKYVACTLQRVTLTWWNSHVKTVTLEVAQALPWKNLKKIMTDKYFPRGKIKKLRTEMWELKIKGTNVIGYSIHFQELALMCDRMFPEESNKVEKYIGGLPDTIHASVKAIRTKTMQEAIKFATELMDKRIRDVVENKQKFEVLETQAYRQEWQRQDTDDHATRAIMHIKALEARARVDTLEDTGSSS
nr:hypothetical protein [Tanacetum cinerariifolium]